MNVHMSKNIKILIAATALLVIACAEKETFYEVNYDQKDIIAFDVYHSKKTKAAIEQDMDLTESNGGIGVYAFKYWDKERYNETNNPTGVGIVNHKIDFSSVSGEHGNPIFNNTMVYINPDFGNVSASNYTQKFIYGYPKQWDKQMYYVFFAYAPRSATGVVLDDHTGLFEFTEMHKIQCASNAQDKAVDSGAGVVTKKQYSVLADGTNAAAIKDYLIAPCQADEKWHATDQSEHEYDKANVTIGFNFSHLLSKFDVNVKAKKEWSGTINEVAYTGHEYKGVKSIYITNLKITKLPELSNLSANYLTKCQQNQVNFTSIYDDGAVTFDPSYYTTDLGIVSSSVDNTTTPATTVYSINGEANTTEPLYILAGGSITEDATTHALTFTCPGNNVVDGYVDQAFSFYIAPNTPNTADKHQLVIDYYIEYVNGDKEPVSRTVDLSAAPYNFKQMKPGFIYTINLEIGLDQIYVTVEDFEWNSGTPSVINVNSANN